MQETKVIKGNSIDKIWQQMDTDFSYSPELFKYDAIIYQNQNPINLTINIDLCGGFEGGYALTNFISELVCDDNFRFVIHHNDFIDRRGKFSDLDDVKIGIKDFDDKIVCRTNEIDRLKELFFEESIRVIFQSLPQFHFYIARHTSDYTQVESSFLELRIDGDSVPPRQLRKVYDAYVLILDKIEEQGSSILKFI